MLKTLVSRGCLAVAMATQFAAAAVAAGPTTTPSCARDADASVLSAAPVVVPPTVELHFVKGTTWVQIDLSPAGSVTNASIYKSAGNPHLDAAALTATRLSVFRPEVRNCWRQGGSYLYAVTFD